MFGGVVALFLVLQAPPEFPQPTARFTPTAVPAAKNANRGLRVYVQEGDRMKPVGSACPVSPRVAYTAKHVITGEEGRFFVHPDYGYDARPELFIEVTVVKPFDGRDVAQLVLGSSLDFWFQRSGVPVPGETVIGSMPLISMAQPPVFGTYLGYVTDPEGESYHLSTMPTAGGASGSCALDIAGKAWGITLGKHSWGSSDPLFATIAARHAAIPKKD